MNDDGIEWLVGMAMMAVAVLLLLCGCAQDRYLSMEQDQKFRETCEHTECVVVPVPLMRQLLDRLKGVAI